MNSTPQTQSTQAKSMRMRNTRVTVSVQVNGTPEAVFDYLADYRHQAKWNNRMVGMEQLTAGPIGAQTTFLLKSKKPVKGQRLEAKFVITEYERPRKLTVTADHAIMQMHDRYLIELQGATVKVTQQAVMQSPTVVSVLFLLMSPIGYLTNRRTLRKFKQAFEAQRV